MVNNDGVEHINELGLLDASWESGIVAGGEHLNGRMNVEVGKPGVDEGFAGHSSQHVSRVHEQHRLLVQEAHDVLLRVNQGNLLTMKRI